MPPRSNRGRGLFEGRELFEEIRYTKLESNLQPVPNWREQPATCTKLERATCNLYQTGESNLQPIPNWRATCNLYQTGESNLQPVPNWREQPATCTKLERATCNLYQTGESNLQPGSNWKEQPATYTKLERATCNLYQTGESNLATCHLYQTGNRFSLNTKTIGVWVADEERDEEDQEGVQACEPHPKVPLPRSTYPLLGAWFLVS